LPRPPNPPKRRLVPSEVASRQVVDFQ
jgi:hypothetical protein